MKKCPFDAATLTIAALAIITGCAAAGSSDIGGGQSGGPLNLTLQTDGVNYKVETMVSNLDTPWAMAFSSAGDLYFTERIGTVSVLRKGAASRTVIGTIADSTETGGEGGLMGLALHPDFATNGHLYIAYNSRSAGGIKVERYTATGDQIGSPKLILDGIGGGTNHDGCALRFGPDGKLYMCTGERYEKELAQKMDVLNGKTLRLNDDGTVPGDNPFVATPGARPEIWSYGHRNCQALGFAPGTSLQVQAEHGPSGSDAPGGGDEVNIIQKGANYGWPLVHHRDTLAGTVAPVLEYTPAVAPGGADFYRGSLFPGWEGDFIFTNLRGSCLIRVDFDSGKIVGHYKSLTNLGRLRAIAVAADGSIYVGTSNQDGRGNPAATDDRILRLTPQ
jgi:glucose/arabinose dehydrogenase